MDNHYRNSQKASHIASSACAHCSLVDFSIQVKPKASKPICSFRFTEQNKLLGGYQGCCLLGERCEQQLISVMSAN